MLQGEEDLRSRTGLTLQDWTYPRGGDSHARRYLICQSRHSPPRTGTYPREGDSPAGRRLTRREATYPPGGDLPAGRRLTRREATYPPGGDLPSREGPWQASADLGC